MLWLNIPFVLKMQLFLIFKDSSITRRSLSRRSNPTLVFWNRLGSGWRHSYDVEDCAHSCHCRSTSDLHDTAHNCTYHHSTDSSHDSASHTSADTRRRRNMSADRQTGTVGVPTHRFPRAPNAPPAQQPPAKPPANIYLINSLPISTDIDTDGMMTRIGILYCKQKASGWDIAI